MRVPPRPYVLCVIAALIGAACGSHPAGGSGTPTPTGSPSASPTPASPYHLRIATANLSSGNGQNWDGGEGLRILQGIKPDVAMLEEWNYGGNTDPELRAFVNTAFGADFSYTRESGAQIPNGVVSRWPILASGTWTDPQVTNRAFEWAHVDLPGATDLWVVAVHLLTTSGTDRAAEASALLGHLQNDVTAGDFVVVGGDFNTDNRNETCIATLRAALTVGPAFPVDQSGNENTNAPRSKPYDWVLANSALEAWHVGTDLPSHSFPDGLVADTRVYDPIGDLAPALAGDSGASGMQHMAVVRDFQVTP